MATILYLTHRLPAPPDKGDKVRTHHILRYLAGSHRVLLGSLVDDADDWRHVESLRPFCEDMAAVPLRPLAAGARALASLATSSSFTTAYFRETPLLRWVDEVCDAGAPDLVLASTSAMIPYARRSRVPVLVDFMDLDSAKWAAYAQRSRGPRSWLFAREARRLSDFERRSAHAAARCYFVTDREAEPLRRAAPGASGRVAVLGNGVDADYFRPDPDRRSPFTAGERALVFTGTMNYAPNVEAVLWLVREVLPRLRVLEPRVRLHVVGRAPVRRLLALAERAASAVVVTGTVDDVRPYLQHAAVVVAPLRSVHGLPNKVLEAMAMGRPVVTARACGDILDVVAGRDVLLAEDAEEYVRCVAGVLRSPDRAQALGLAAREAMLDRYDWSERLAPLGRDVEHLARRGVDAPMDRSGAAATSVA